MRTIDQIQADMDAVQASLPEASGLTARSNTSVFGTLRNLWALLTQALENYLDGLSSDLTSYVATAQIGGIAWYASQVKAFQFGDAVTLVNGRPGYATVDAAKQIVNQVSVVETDGRLLVKAAKPNGLDNQALSEGELAALKEWVRAFKYAGVAVDVVSLPPDELKIQATVKYDRSLVNAQGQLLTQTDRVPANEAIIIYIRSLPFDSVLNWTALTDYCQTYPGVKDFLVTRTWIRPAGATDWTEFTRETTSRAGHMKLVDAQMTYV